MKKLSLVLGLFAVILAFSACKDSGKGGGGGSATASAMDKFIWTEYDSSAGGSATFSADLINQTPTKALDAKLGLFPAGIAPNGDIFWVNGALGIFISNINQKDPVVRSLITTKKIFDDYLEGYKNSSNTIPDNYGYKFFQDPSDKNHYKAILYIANNYNGSLIYDSADGSISKSNLPAYYEPILYGPNQEYKIFDDALMTYGTTADGKIGASLLYKPFTNTYEAFTTYSLDNMSYERGFIYTDRSKMFNAKVDETNMLIEGFLYTPLGKEVSISSNENTYMLKITDTLTESPSEKLFSVSYKSIPEKDRKYFVGLYAANEKNVFAKFHTQSGTVSVYKIDVASGTADKVGEYYEAMYEANSSSPSLSTNAMVIAPSRSSKAAAIESTATDTTNSGSSSTGLTSGYGVAYQETSDDELLLINKAIIYSAKRNASVDLRKSFESNGSYLTYARRSINGNMSTIYGSKYFSPDGKYLLCKGGRVVLLDQLFKDGEPTFIKVLPENEIEYNLYTWNGYELWFTNMASGSNANKIYATKGFDPATVKVLRESSSTIDHRNDATVTNFVPTITAGLDVSVPMTDQFACAKGGFYCADQAATCANGTCTATACQTAATCPLGYDCLGSTKVCTKKNEGACYDVAQCITGYSCINNVCTYGGSCTPACTGKECGDDGCGGTCGECGTGSTCNSENKCEVTCTPSCTNKECGDDGCGGSCGTCNSDKACNTSNKCVDSTSCTPSCDEKTCGDNGCGGVCGTCQAPLMCSGGNCINITPENLNFSATLQQKDVKKYDLKTNDDGTIYLDQNKKPVIISSTTEKAPKCTYTQMDSTYNSVTIARCEYKVTVSWTRNDAQYFTVDTLPITGTPSLTSAINLKCETSTGKCLKSGLAQVVEFRKLPGNDWQPGRFKYMVRSMINPNTTGVTVEKVATVPAPFTKQ